MHGLELSARADVEDTGLGVLLEQLAELDCADWVIAHNVLPLGFQAVVAWLVQMLVQTVVQILIQLAIPMMRWP
jgi:hypothetical protein